MKKCPFCAEEIQDEAVLCRFCGQFLDPKKKKVPLYLRPGSLVTAVLCVGPLAIPLFWLHPHYSLRKKISSTVIVLLLTWGMVVLLKKAITAIIEYYSLLLDVY